MARIRSAALAVVVFACPALAQPPADRLDRTLAAQAALAEARELLTANKSAAAVAVLEKALPAADGGRAYLDLLRSAYAAEVKRLQLANADPSKVNDLRTKLALLGVAPAEPAAADLAPPMAVPVVAPVPAPAADPEASPAGTAALRRATDLFAQAKLKPALFGDAAKMFASAFLGKVKLSPTQEDAWAYCRVRVAADRLAKNAADPAVAAEVAAEVEEALKHAPANADLQKVGGDLLMVARQRAGTAVAVAPAPVAAPVLEAAAADGWEVVETASFRVRHRGHRAAAEEVAKRAEEKREAVCAKWAGGPPGGTWEPKCEVVLHPDATGFAAATGLPAAATGRAVVKLADGRAVERRIDLRADDAAHSDDALPRELSYVVLADLFPYRAPPAWAELGMAVLAASPAEVDRYKRTAVRCAEAGQLPTAAAILEAKAPPADQLTGFHAGSVSLVEFLVKWKGEKAFKTFVGDSHRYGLGSALQRQYGVADAAQLDELWKRQVLSAARAQAP